jgi:hypothetical protein
LIQDGLPTGFTEVYVFRCRRPTVSGEHFNAFIGLHIAQNQTKRFIPKQHVYAAR